MTKFVKVRRFQQVLRLRCGNILVSPWRERRKGNKTLHPPCQTVTNTHLRHFMAQIVKFRVQLLFNKCHFSKNIAMSAVLWTIYHGVIMLLGFTRMKSEIPKFVTGSTVMLPVWSFNPLLLFCIYFFFGRSSPPRLFLKHGTSLSHCRAGRSSVWKFKHRERAAETQSRLGGPAV